MKSVWFSTTATAATLPESRAVIWETVIAEGNQADLMSVVEADREGIDWNKYDLVIAGAPVIYGKFHKSFRAFVNKFKSVLAPRPTASSPSPSSRAPPPSARPKATCIRASSLNESLEAQGCALLRRQGRLPELELV